ncbi:DUF2332 domain-containing protein [Halapricum sp. CBA1109]|uniref:DUF2332 domain-containing protein n=1 Tax=Halapricum sp. CBA1109 TaxID=2668068 RepID=UPI001E2BA009|nr:DUF2332 domain-containing protein [Halapricum sp. CBA1109]
MDDDPSVAAAFEELARWADGPSPLYERLCRAAAADPALRALAREVPDDRSTANVFLAAVHRTLFDHSDHPLGEYYPTVADDPRPPDDGLGDALRSFCVSHAGSLRPRLRTRRTQTNSVRRSAVLYPAITHVADRVEGPLALVELGPSAGLNLLVDRYEYDYSGSPAGDIGSAVTIETDLRGGDPPLSTDPPAIHSRTGIDLNPLDLTDPEDAAWLRALVWPDQRERHRALASAIDLGREDPPEIVAGDLLADLPAVLESIPDDVPICVFDTLVLYQVPDDVRERLGSTIREYARERPLHWLAGEAEFGDHDASA